MTKPTKFQKSLLKLLPEKEEPQHYCREDHLRDNDGNIIATAIIPVESVRAKYRNEAISEMEAKILKIKDDEVKEWVD